MAYAALVSLEQTINQIRNQDRYSTSPQLISLHEDVISLQACLEDFPEEANNLEVRMRDVATAAEDIIECFMLKKHIEPKLVLEEPANERELKTVAEEMDVIAAKDIIESFKLKQIELSYKYLSKKDGHLSHFRSKHFCLMKQIEPSLVLKEPANKRELKTAKDIIHKRSRRKDNLSRFMKLIERKLWDPLKEAQVARNELEWELKEEAQVARNELEPELKIVAEEIATIAAEVGQRKNNIIIKDDHLSDSSIASSSSGLGKIKMIGFDDDLMEIKNRLIGTSPKLQFLSIVGMGGIGKTTLAKNAYDDQLVQGHFQIRAWVTISQDYRAREILSSLLHSMKEFDPRRYKQDNKYMQGISENINEMRDRVYKILYGRKYVIVMDDMWSTKVLDDVWKLFPDNGNGSRILLTTRLSNVAAYADPSIPPYVMCSMDEDQSWNLFRDKVFPHEDGISPELEIIGKEITRSCKGLPLAVVVVAGVVSTISKTPASWGGFAKKVKYSIVSKDERLEKIVSLSYNHLPHHLRPCFLYMGAFPEDYKIHVSELIKLWIAEGFLKHPKGSKSLEEGAEEYLEDLVRRNLILVNERKFNGKIKSVSLHDMVRDTCTKLLEEENNLRQVRDNFLENEGNPSCISMRSVLCFDDIQGSLEHFQLLRVLHVPKSKTRWEWPPLKIEKLLHLRYLAFACCEIPSTISNFQNLQTLVTREDFCINLPSSIWKLRQLRHLIFRGSLDDPKEPTSPLENLQTLKQVFDNTNGAHFHKRIPNLKKLGLLYNIKDISGGANLIGHLVYLHQLEKLKMNFLYPADFLDAVFPCSLKKFTLGGYCKLSQPLLKSIGLLPSLEVLKLWHCSLDLDHSSWEIGGGEFPQLKFLMIGKLVQFEALITEDSSALPRLKCLQLQHCKDLREISDDIGEIPTLELIEVNSCGEYVNKWAKQIQEEQQNLGNDTPQVRFHCRPYNIDKRKRFLY